MFCRNCGNKLQEGDKFCNKCGAKVEPKEELEVNKGDSVLSDKVISSPFLNNEKPEDKIKDEIPKMNWESEEPTRKNNGIDIVWDKEEPITYHKNINKEMEWDEVPERKTGDINFVWDTEDIPKNDNRNTDSIKFDWSSVVDDKERSATKKIPAWRMASRTRPEEIIEEKPKATEEPITFEPETKPYIPPVQEEPEKPLYFEQKFEKETQTVVPEDSENKPYEIPKEEEKESELKPEKEPEVAKKETESAYEPFLVKEKEIAEKQEDIELKVPEYEPQIQGAEEKEEIESAYEPFLVKEKEIAEKQEMIEPKAPEYKPQIKEGKETNQKDAEVLGMDNKDDILDKPEYISPFDEDDEMDPELVELEKELFANMEDDYVDKKATIKIDKFYTLDKKSEDFQSLLDKEYEKIKKSGVNYDLMEEGDFEVYTEEDEYVPGSLEPSELYGTEETLYKEKPVEKILYKEEPKEEVIADEVKSEMQKEENQESTDDEELEKKKSHGALKFLVAILIILVLLELFILAMNNFAPDSAITQTLNDGIRSITDLISDNKELNLTDYFMA